MKATKLTYSKLVNLGNYENCKIELEMEIEPGEKASDVYNLAKEWVDRRAEVQKTSDFYIQKAQHVINDKRNHTLAQIEEAESFLAKIDIDNEAFPF